MIVSPLGYVNGEVTVNVYLKHQTPIISILFILLFIRAVGWLPLAGRDMGWYVVYIGQIVRVAKSFIWTR